MSHLILFLMLIAASTPQKTPSSPATDFTCPEDFGYFPHPTDCTQYYVCVFGGALLESCTGGLMYSHDLQTCDWPRNVYCYNGTTFVDNNNVQQAPQESRSRSRGTPAPSSASRGSYSYNPIKIETYGQLRNAAEESVVGKKPGRVVLPDDEYQQQRSGRSYEGSVPNYKEEIYQRGRQPHTRTKRQTHRTSIFELYTKRHARSRQTTKKNNLDILNPKTLSKYNINAQAGLKRTPMLTHRVSSPGTVLYPPSFYQTPTYGFVNIDRPLPTISITTPPPRNVKIKDNTHDSSYYSSQAFNFGNLVNYNPNYQAYQPEHHVQVPEKTLSEYVTNAYVSRFKNHDVRGTSSPLPQSNEFPKKIVLSTGSLQHGFGETKPSVSSSPLQTTRSKYTGNTNKYYDNTAPVLQQPQQDYGTEDAYVNQRYAANVGNNTGSYYYTPGSASEDDDSSYYVYDDEEEEPQQGDVKYQQPQQQVYRTPPPQTTRRPTTPIQPTSQRTPSRTPSRTRTSSSSTRSRPTLKPKSSIVKQASQPVRDVYLDPPSRPENVYESPVPNTPATKCKKDLCVLPDCNCGGKDIPGGLRPEETPQIVLLTFDDSVNDLNKNLYRDLFEKGRKNPNGCPISATFYISHEWTDYSQVQNLAADGHEIASHSVSHSFGEQYSQKKWDREINGQREILAAYGGVKLSEVRGMRAPFLAIGGNNMFKMLHDSNFTYDSSMPIYENRPPSWPYTLDYRVFHDCMIPPCPTKSYPGVWEVPMVMWQDLKGGRCSMGDACSNPPTAEGVYQMLAKNFERHYTTNRAPFGLYYHAAWFTQAHHKEGFEAFLDTLVQMDDVWLVTNWQALQWIRNPTPNSRVINFEPWSCHDNKDRPPRCNHPKVCNLWHKSGVRYMKTCQHCPQQYPWTGNTGVPYSNSL